MAGGGGSVYYQGLNDLYNAQTANANMLMGESQKTFADLGNLRQEAANYGSVANQNKVAGQAEADYTTQFNSGINSLDKNLESYGIDPSNPQSIRMKGEMANNAFATGAGGMTNARQQVANQGYNMQQGITSLGMGLPAQATSAYNSAGNAMSQAGTLANQNAAMESSSLGNMTSAGINLATLFHANGGEITPLRRFEGGGFVSPFYNGGMAQSPTGYAGGGSVSALKDIQAPPPPGSAGPSPMTSVATNALAATATNPTARAWATKQVNALLGPGTESGNAAMAQFTGQGLGGTAGAQQSFGNGINFGADAASALPAAAADVGESLSLSPEVLALAGLANGGQPHPLSRHPKNGIRGGPVHGPGGPKDDLIPAMLSNGEFVMPVGTVKKFGLDKLEKMRQDGLAFEKQLGIRSH